MFDIIDLFPFFQLMAGLNFAPSFFGSLQTLYFNPIYSISSQYKQELVVLFDQKIKDINNSKNITFGLNDKDKETTKKLEEKAKKNYTEHYTTYKNVIITEHKTQTENINNKVKNIINSDSKKIRYSFLTSGVFCVFILIFVPISELFFPTLCTSILVRYINYFILSQLVFQFIFFFTNRKHFLIFCYYLLSIFLIFIVYVIYFKYYQDIVSNEHICNYVSYRWKKFSIIFLITSTLITFLLYLLKYIVILIINRIHLKKEFKKKISNMKEVILE